jgi:hypothetical protein
MTLAILKFTEVFKLRFNCRVARSTVSSVGESKRECDRFSLDKAVEALSGYKDMPRSAYLKVMKALYKKDNKVAFLTMPNDRKNAWIESIADGSFFYVNDGWFYDEI